MSVHRIGHDETIHPYDALMGVPKKAPEDDRKYNRDDICGYSGRLPQTESAPEAGRKYDGDKSPVVQGCLHYFPRALKAIAVVSEYGRKKYKTTFADKNWEQVENGLNRYTDADGRHLLDEAIDGPYDFESNLLHAAHHAWDACARLEKLLASGVELRNAKSQGHVPQEETLPG